MKKLRIGVCTESFYQRFNTNLAHRLSHRLLCVALAAQGWDFLEVAPAGFETHLVEMTDDQLEQLKREAEESEIPYATGHWLMSFTKHVLTSAEESNRRGGTEFLIQLAHALGKLGVARVVYGSPPSRIVPETGAEDAHYERFSSAIAAAMPAFRDCGIEFLFEFLSRKETLFGNTPDEALRIAKLIGADRIHFDIKAASPLADDVHGVCELLKRYAGNIGYVHFNDANGAYPGFGAVDGEPGSGETTDFRPIFRTLREIGYNGDASVEMFNFMPNFPGYPASDPLDLLGQSIRYLRNCEAAI
ncbi:MAG: sugar phosphate isomerase/epimerase family protein [Bdellovibrionota bacterium]